MYIINDTELLAYVDTYYRPLSKKIIPVDLKATLPFFLSSRIHTTEKEESCNVINSLFVFRGSNESKLRSSSMWTEHEGYGAEWKYL